MQSNFNSHPRVGGDIKLLRNIASVVYFNSHPRVGGDCHIYQHQPYHQISIRTPAWGVTAKIHKTVCNHLYIFAALCAFCSEITQQKTIIIRILKENTSIHCADLPENYARL